MDVMSTVTNMYIRTVTCGFHGSHGRLKQVRIGMGSTSTMRTTTLTTGTPTGSSTARSSGRGRVSRPSR